MYRYVAKPKSIEGSAADIIIVRSRTIIFGVNDVTFKPI